jgi:glycosyltransferase involved in cell wall biosynthesis
MPKFYDLCDVFVLPSDFEPWGLAINEVMNAGKALVVSDCVGCAPDLIADKHNGCIFPVGDVKALAESIQWAIANAESAGKSSFKRIQNWSFRENIVGLKASLAEMRR